MKPCKCENPINVALIQAVVYHNANENEIKFLIENQLKFICYDCGGEVEKDIAGENCNMVSGTVICSRLKELKIL